MNDNWGARFVDKQVAQAWLDFRMALADRLAAGIASPGMVPLDITTATGETLTATIDEQYVVVVAGDDLFTTANVDEAAYTVFEVLHDSWQVMHPVFLSTDLVESPAIADNPVGHQAVVVPVLGEATDKAQLQSWVEATLSDLAGKPVAVGANGLMAWRTRKGGRVTVQVRNAGRIEITTVLARQVGFRKAQQAIGELSRTWFGLKFYLVQDRLMMSQTVIAMPYSGEQLTAALRLFMTNADELTPVQEMVLSKRAKADRADVAKAKEAQAAAEAALASAQELLAEAECTAERRKLERDWARWQMRHAKAEAFAASEEGDAAQAQLRELRSLLEMALGRKGVQQFDCALPLAEDGARHRASTS